MNEDDSGTLLLPEQDECPHYEYEHGICLDCGKDILNYLIGQSELLEDE